MINTVLLVLVAAQTLTVDDDGKADFTDLPEAVAAAKAGYVIRVEPGTYSGALVTKSLTILARDSEPRPTIFGEFEVRKVETVTLVGLEFNDLRLEHIKGRARVDDCLVTGSFDFGDYGTFHVEGCSDVLISRTEAYGHAPSFFDGTAALTLDDSSGQLVDCRLYGVDGNDDVIEPDDGYPGLDVRGTSSVRVVASIIEGGDGGCAGLGLGHGQGSPAITGGGFGVTDVNITGSDFHAVRGGTGCFGPQAAAASGLDTLKWGGVTMEPGPPPGGTWVLPAPPYFNIRGVLDFPGGERGLLVYGENGDTAFIFLSLGTAEIELPGFLGAPLLFDPSGIVFTAGVTLNGQDDYAFVDIVLPASAAFAGLAIEGQALVLSSGGGPSPIPIWTNSAQIVLRY